MSGGKRGILRFESPAMSAKVFGVGRDLQGSVSFIAWADRDVLPRPLFTSRNWNAKTAVSTAFWFLAVRVFCYGFCGATERPGSPRAVKSYLDHGEAGS